MVQLCCDSDPNNRASLSTIIHKLSAQSPNGDIYYERGKKLEKQGKLAAAYGAYQRASQKDSFKAYTNMGFFHLQGVGDFHKDKKKAYELFLKGVAGGHPRAMFNAASILNKGCEGVPANPVEAKRLIKRAAELGDRDARALLERSKSRGLKK